MLWQLLSVVIILSIRVAYSHRAVPWHGYYVAESQRSDMMQLEEGEDYLLVADFAEGYGYEYINVRASPYSTTPGQNVCCDYRVS